MEPWVKDYIWVIVLLPLAGAAFNGLVGFKLDKKVVSWVGCGTIAAAFAIGLVAFFSLLQLSPQHRHLTNHLYTWISVGKLKADAAFLVDPLSAIMILVVTGVGFVIHVYSVGYMAHDKSYWRFFSHLNLFIFFMLLLVLGDNLFLLFVGWEGVGLCSYLLIGFWYTEKYNVVCGMKAFIVNRIGDFGFIIGIFILFWAMAGQGVWTLNFMELQENAHLLADVKLWGVGVATLATLFFFVGAAGKSAQIPLYVWLPDAMAGPTPVSALIHAATMVTAGVYMIGRLNFLYLMAPVSLTVVAVVGAATAILAASIGIAQNDIKRVLAYSTISQLGYMFMAMGVAAFSAGIFHLMTHAFFKALLFLGAGSVIHAMNDKQDMREMGGARKRMPVTFWTFLVATLAITGIPGFAGFFSKDEILWMTASTPNPIFEKLPSILWIVGFLVAGLTAFYMFRLVFMTFFGQCRADEHTRSRIHESPRAMTIPLVVLALFSVLGGYFGVPAILGGSNRIHNFLAPVFGGGGAGHALSPGVTLVSTAAKEVSAAAQGSHGLEVTLMVFSVIVALAGIFVANLMYRKHPDYPARLAGRFQVVYRAIFNKYYVDEFYHIVFTATLLRINAALAWFDDKVIDGIVNGVGWITRRVSSGNGVFDNLVIDGMVNGLAESTISAGGRLRKIQSGRIQTDLYYVLGGILIIVMIRLVV